MQEKDITKYGGPYENFAATENPQSEMDAEFGNRLMEDAAQLTQTGLRAMVRFTTVSGGVPPFAIPTANITHWTVWGSGPSTRPTVTKTAQGRYTITWAASYTDGLGVAENVALRDAQAGAISSDAADWVGADVITMASNVVTIKTFQKHAAPPVLHDVGNNSAAVFDASVWMR